MVDSGDDDFQAFIEAHSMKNKRPTKDSSTKDNVLIWTPVNFVSHSRNFVLEF